MSEPAKFAKLILLVVKISEANFDNSSQLSIHDLLGLLTLIFAMSIFESLDVPGLQVLISVLLCSVVLFCSVLWCV